MRTTTDITFGAAGQVVAYRVPQGRPSAASFAAYYEFADDTGPSLFSGSATLDSVTTTLTAASGPSQTDPAKLNMTSTGVVVTRKYLISEGQRSEWIQPVEVATGYVRARHPLKNDYTTAATVVGTTITGAIDATFVAALNNLSNPRDPNPSYRMRWDITVGGVATVAYSFFDLVRAPMTCQVDIDDINARAPGLQDSIPVEYNVEQGRPLVDAALRSVQADFAAIGFEMDALRDDQILDEIVILRALSILASGGWKPMGMTSAEYATITRTEYDRFLEKNFQAVMTRKLADSSGAGATAPTLNAPFWSK